MSATAPFLPRGNYDRGFIKKAFIFVWQTIKKKSVLVLNNHQVNTTSSGMQVSSRYSQANSPFCLR